MSALAESLDRLIAAEIDYLTDAGWRPSPPLPGGEIWWSKWDRRLVRQLEAVREQRIRDKGW
jgi:hypothetical protein